MDINNGPRMVERRLAAVREYFAKMEMEIKGDISPSAQKLRKRWRRQRANMLDKCLDPGCMILLPDML